MPLSGEASVAVVRDGKVERRIETGAGTKPHITALSPDGAWLWITVQGADPKLLAVKLTPGGEEPPREFRYDIVPRVVAATNEGAWFTAHHSTGAHFAALADGKVTTPYVDANGDASEPRKQIEGVAVSPDGRRVALTHEGRRALVVLDVAGGGVAKKMDVHPLEGKPYWVTLDPSLEAAYVSIPDKGLVEAYDTTSSGRMWRAEVGSKPKRMAVTHAP